MKCKYNLTTCSNLNVLLHSKELCDTCTDQQNYEHIDNFRTINKNFKVKFSEEESGSYTEEENEYCGDLVHSINVEANNWEESFPKAIDSFYISNPKANRIYNFTSIEL